MAVLDTKLAISDMVIGEGRKWTNEVADMTEIDIKIDQLVNVLMAECSDIDDTNEELKLKQEIAIEYKESIRRGLNRAHRRMKKILGEEE